jgi:ABC-2 type transport system ATP-binding protein
MTVRQVERFHAAFYPRWKRERFEDLMERMEMPRTRKIARMSCGQRSQVALGLILAQDPDLLILDDYSMGLDAGYRRLFLDFLKDFAREHGRAVLLTSHIVQDLERLVDDVLIIDRGRVLVQMTLAEFRSGLRQYTFTAPTGGVRIGKDDVILNHETVGRESRVWSFADLEAVRGRLADRGVAFEDLRDTPMSLEDAFLGLTGKY